MKWILIFWMFKSANALNGMPHGIPTNTVEFGTQQECIEAFDKINKIREKDGTITVNGVCVKSSFQEK